MKKIFVFCLLLIVYCSLLAPSVRADYVLPYPSYMPGNKMYKISRIFDKVKKFWYFGNIAQIKYHLELSDKYLVEAKTLMEYNQYLLGADALTRSDSEFIQIPKYIAGLKTERVDGQQYKQLIRVAAIKHEEVLQTLLKETPLQFDWNPEKAKATQLNLQQMLNHSIEIRTDVTNDVSSL